MRFTKQDKVHVPWLELAKTPTKYLNMDTIPEGFKVLDPSKLTKAMVGRLWDHWSERAKAKLPILIFINARDQDFGLSRSLARRARHRPLITRTRIQSSSSESDDQAGGDKPLDDHAEKSKGADAADKGEGTSESPVRPPPPNNPHLSEPTGVPDKGSPAANTSDRANFLHSLSGDTSYKSLLDGVLTMPDLVSPFSPSPLRTSLITVIHKPTQSSSLAAKPNLSLPVWASWKWDQNYLPVDIHTRWHVFNAALDLLQGYTFMDCDEGSLVVLGFGLLLCECWRAVEVEEDDEHSPDFLRESLLGKKRADKVIMAIQKIISKSSEEDTDRERQKEKDSSAKGKKAKPSGKKPATTSGPVRNIRSQRQRKPSRKLRESD